MFRIFFIWWCMWVLWWKAWLLWLEFLFGGLHGILVWNFQLSCWWIFWFRMGILVELAGKSCYMLCVCCIYGCMQVFLVKIGFMGGWNDHSKTTRLWDSLIVCPLKLAGLLVLKLKFIGKFCWISKFHDLISVYKWLHVEFGW